MARMVDWEVELAVVIARRVRHVRGTAALECIAGYSILNDISARDWLANPSFMGFDWVMHKGFDGFAPMGPFITPAAFVPDPQALTMKLTVNGQVKQNASTALMAFSVQEIIEHLAAIMTLEPGDVIATSTPMGVGYGRRPQEFLQVGDHRSRRSRAWGVWKPLCSSQAYFFIHAKEIVCSPSRAQFP